MTDRAVAETGPIRNLRARVALPASWVPSPTFPRSTDAALLRRTRRRGRRARPADGVLTPEMARRVLRDKAEHDARWQRAMALWENTPVPSQDGKKPSQASSPERTVSSTVVA